MDREDSERLLAVVRADIERLQGELARLRDLEKYLSGKAGAPEKNGTPMLPAGVAGLDKAAAAEQVLRKRSPMTTMEITDALIASGYPVPGALGDERRRLANGLYTAMLRAKGRLRRVGKSLWALVAAEADVGPE